MKHNKVFIAFKSATYFDPIYKPLSGYTNTYLKTQVCKSVNMTYMWAHKFILGFLIM